MTSRWSPPTCSRSATTCRRATSSSSTRCSSSTPFEVVAEFFPSFRALDKFDAVDALLPGADHDHLRHRRQAHLDRPQPQAARADRGLDPARVRGRRAHGDHGAARPGQRRARPADRRGRGAGRRTGERRRTPGRTGVRGHGARRGPRGVRGPPAARPAGRGDVGDRGVDGRLARQAQAGCWPPSTANPSGRWCSTRSVRRCTCAGSASCRRRGARHRGAARSRPRSRRRTGSTT